jgi:methyl-accepting chemotaxis protein
MEYSLVRDALGGLLIVAIVWGVPAMFYLRSTPGETTARAFVSAWGVGALAAAAAAFLLGHYGATWPALPAALSLAVAGAVPLLVSTERSHAYQNRLLASSLNAARQGDLDQIASLETVSIAGPIGRLCQLIRQLRGTVLDVQIGARDLFGAGEAILAALGQQAAGSHAQSAAIAETTATVEEVKASAQQAAHLADAVAATAREADRISTEGVAAVQNATGGMATISDKVQSITEHILVLSEHSQHIGEIIAAVSDLADQSNMLALNAAIEATRAGEHGRGFAVVAHEIRALAEQSKAATAEIRSILSDIQRATNAAVMATEEGTKGVAAGTRLIDRAGDTINALASVIQDASGSAQQISAAVRQHFIGMEQIVTAMTDISRATEGNLEAGAATEMAAHALIALAERLSASVATYVAVPNDEDLARMATPKPLASAYAATPTVGFDFSGLV